jgi:flavorubredoxin
MTVTNKESGTNVHEVADGIYRINTPVAIEGAGGFSFNQYLIVDDQPLLFHTGPRKLFPLVREAVASVLPIERLRYIGFSHVEADECGSLNEWLVAAPQSVPLCGTVAALVSVNDLADRHTGLGMESCSLLANIPYDGSTLPISLTRGNVGF